MGLEWKGFGVGSGVEGLWGWVLRVFGVVCGVALYCLSRPMGLRGHLWGGPVSSGPPYGSLERSVGWPYSVYPTLWVFGGIYGAVLYTMAHPMGLRGPSVGWPYSIYPSLWVFGVVCGVAP